MTLVCNDALHSYVVNHTISMSRSDHAGCNDELLVAVNVLALYRFQGAPIRAIVFNRWDTSKVLSSMQKTRRVIRLGNKPNEYRVSGSLTNTLDGDELAAPKLTLVPCHLE